MSEASYRLKFSTSADVGGMEQIDAGLRKAAGSVEQLSRMFDNLAQSGMGAEKVSLGSVLKAAPMISAAWDLGTQIGEAVGDAVTRVGERGMSLDALLGKYDARFDESIARWKEGVNQVMEDLGKAPPRTLLDYLDELKQKTEEAIAQAEHLAKLQDIKQRGDEAEQQAAFDQEEQDIAADDRLTPEQKEAAQAGLQKRREKAGYMKREDDREDREQAALTKETEYGKQAWEAELAMERQKKRVEEARRADLEAGQKWIDQGNQGVAPEDFLRGNRKEGLGLQKEEASILKKAQKDLEDARRKKEEASGERQRVQEVTAAEREEDARVTRRNMGNIDADVRDANRGRQRAGIEAEGAEARERANAEGQAAAAGSGAEVGQAADEMSQTMQQGAGDAAESLRRVSSSIESNFATLNSAVSEMAAATRAAQQTAQQALQEAKAAREAAAQNKTGSRYR